MDNQIKLSVLIPTLNRIKYLEITLNFLLSQIERNLDKTELVICNNSSIDDTDSFINSLLPHYPFINYYFFEEYVEICDSFSRSILKTKGQYVLILGDDDIPYPYLIELILDIIESKDNIGLIHFNRLVGRDQDFSMVNLRVEQKKFTHHLNEYSLSEFLSLYPISAGFISSLVFTRSAWEKGLPYHSKEHHGYEFLGIIYNGVKGMKCFYSDFPLVIQRNPYVRDWFHKLPLYWFLGIPNIMKDIDKWRLSEGALIRWQATENKSMKTFLYILFVASAYKSIYKPLCKKINVYQDSYIRKCLTYLIIYLVPSFLYRWARKKFYFN